MRHRSKLTPIAMAFASMVLSLSAAHAETQIKVNGTLYRDFTTVATELAGAQPGTDIYVWLNADNVAANTSLRATQRSLGFREVDYKAKFSESLNFSQVASTTVGSNTVYDYGTQSSSTNLVGFWKSKDLPILVGTDGNAYITDGHHTTAGYLAANTAAREMVPGMGHVVLGHIVAGQNYFVPASPAAPTDAWWTARQTANNALLYGPNGNQLTRSGEPNFASLQPVLPSVQAMPTVPGKVSMTNDDYRAVTWGMADGIIGGVKGYSKGNAFVNGATDINFVEFYWADFLRNRVVFDNSKSGSVVDSGKADANLIAAPLSFYAAVANGTALAKSEVYKDQYGRALTDYAKYDGNGTAVSYLVAGNNTETWAGASLKNGLAIDTNKYKMYLLDDSTVQGDITPSALSKNSLYIDTVAGQTVNGRISNFASVDINKGSTIQVKWKDGVLQTAANQPLMTIAAGNGTVTFTAQNDYAGATRIGGGTLVVAAGGSIDNSSSIEVGNGAQLVNNGVIGGGAGSGAVTVLGGGAVGGSGVFNRGVSLESGAHLAPGNSPGTLTFAGGLTLKDGSVLDFDLGTQSDLILVSGGLFTGSNDHGVAVNLKTGPGFLTGTRYTLFNWNGAAMAGVDTSDFYLSNLPAGETAKFSISGTTLGLTLAPVPEPESYALMLAGLGLLGFMSRRRKNLSA